MSKKLAAIAVLAFGMFIAAPLAANAQIPAGVTIHTEDEAPDDAVGGTDEVDPQIMESGVTIEDKMLTTAGAPEAESGLSTGAILAIAAGSAAVLGAGGFFVVRARKKA